MATTVYFEDALNENDISPTVAAAWSGGTCSGFERHRLNVSGTKEGTAHANVTTTIAAISEECQLQYISPALAAQTISGTMDIGIKQIVSAIGATFFAYNVRIVDSGGTHVATLYDATANTGNAINSTLNYTDEFDGTLSLTSQSCSQGDRLVIEIGYDVNNSTSKTMGCKIGSASANNVTSDSTSTTLRNGNAVFSDTIIFSEGSSKLMLMGVG